MRSLCSFSIHAYTARDGNNHTVCYYVVRGKNKRALVFPLVGSPGRARVCDKITDGKRN